MIIKINQVTGRWAMPNDVTDEDDYLCRGGIANLTYGELIELNHKVLVTGISHLMDSSDQRIYRLHTGLVTRPVEVDASPANVSRIIIRGTRRMEQAATPKLRKRMMKTHQAYTPVYHTMVSRTSPPIKHHLGASSAASV